MLAILAALATGVTAENNAFTYPAQNGIQVNTGDAFTIKWANVSGPTASLILRTGDPKQLQTVQTIASNINNQGSYDWTVPADLNTGSYSIEITADGDDNYSTFFTIHGKNVTVSSSASSSKAASSSILSSSRVSSSVGASSSAAASSAVANNSVAHSSSAPVSSSVAKSSSAPKVTTSAPAVAFPNTSVGSNHTVNGTAGISSSAAASASGSASATSKAKTPNGASFQSWSAGAVGGAVAAVAMLMI